MNDLAPEAIICRPFPQKPKYCQNLVNFSTVPLASMLLGLLPPLGSLQTSVLVCLSLTLLNVAVTFSVFLLFLPYCLNSSLHHLSLK